MRAAKTNSNPAAAIPSEPSHVPRLVSRSQTNVRALVVIEGLGRLSHCAITIEYRWGWHTGIPPKKFVNYDVIIAQEPRNEATI